MQNLVNATSTIHKWTLQCYQCDDLSLFVKYFEYNFCVLNIAAKVTKTSIVFHQNYNLVFISDERVSKILLSKNELENCNL